MDILIMGKQGEGKTTAARYFIEGIRKYSVVKRPVIMTVDGSESAPFCIGSFYEALVESKPDIVCIDGLVLDAKDLAQAITAVSRYRARHTQATVICILVCSFTSSDIPVDVLKGLSQ